MTLRKKLQITIVCLSVILCTLVTGTIAWLTDKTDPVTNTFTPSNIDVELSETKGGTNKEFKMVPGATIEKDPTITVAANSEACWLFVKIEEKGGDVTVGEVSHNFDAFVTYEMAADTQGAKIWTPVNGTTGVYYRQVGASDTAQDFPVLNDNKVTVKSDVTKAMMDALYADTTKYPTLTFTAYAIQQEGFGTAELAWAEISK